MATEPLRPFCITSRVTVWGDQSPRWQCSLPVSLGRKVIGINLLYHSLGTMDFWEGTLGSAGQTFVVTWEHWSWNGMMSLKCKEQAKLTLQIKGQNFVSMTSQWKRLNLLICYRNSSDCRKTLFSNRDIYLSSLLKPLTSELHNNTVLWAAILSVTCFLLDPEGIDQIRNSYCNRKILFFFFWIFLIPRTEDVSSVLREWVTGLYQGWRRYCRNAVWQQRESLGLLLLEQWSTQTILLFVKLLLSSSTCPQTLSCYVSGTE